MKKAKAPKTVILMRRACFQEDGGRDCYIMTCSQEEAKEWLAEQVGEFYGPNDYYMVPKKG